MKVISVNGIHEIVENKNDVYELMEKYMGQEARETAEALIDGTELIEAKEQEVEILRDEKDSYDVDLESNSYAFQDIETICRSMIQDFNEETGRNRLASLRPWRNKVEEIIKIINNQI